MPEPAVLGIVLASADPGRVHAALSMAAAGAAMGRRVVFLATGPGCRALAAAAPFDPAHETRLRDAGVATSATLRDALVELGATLLACDAALRVEAPGPLHPAATVAGMATFLSQVGTGATMSF